MLYANKMFYEIFNDEFVISLCEKGNTGFVEGLTIESIMENLKKLPNKPKRILLTDNNGLYTDAECSDFARRFNMLSGLDYYMYIRILKNRFTSENITALKPNEIFVFGSNLEGQHLGGAAKVAYEKFGAKWGEGVGFTGKCYAIPTMHGGIEKIKPYVDEFIKQVKLNKQLHFLVTKIGCGIAGFSVDEIAPLFKELMSCENASIPKEFYDYLKR